jgi:phosphatidylglycerophosphate synthase
MIAKPHRLGDKSETQSGMQVMLDAPVRLLIDPPLRRAGERLAQWGWNADLITLAGLGLGIAAAGLIFAGYPLLALVPLLASRLADGLDGAVARAGKRTDFGGFLDISADFMFYGLVPLAFVLSDPATHGAAGAFLLASFYFNGATFLGFAILAEKRSMTTSIQGQKSLYFSNGLLEGTETIGFFVLLCLFPGHFSLMAWIFGGLCFLSGMLRVIAARNTFRH